MADLVLGPGRWTNEALTIWTALPPIPQQLRIYVKRVSSDEQPEQ
jgi:hypothetical protein